MLSSKGYIDESSVSLQLTGRFKRLVLLSIGRWRRENYSFFGIRLRNSITSRRRGLLVSHSTCSYFTFVKGRNGIQWRSARISLCCSKSTNNLRNSQFIESWLHLPTDCLRKPCKKYERYTTHGTFRFSMSLLILHKLKNFMNSKWSFSRNWFSYVLRSTLSWLRIPESWTGSEFNFLALNTRNIWNVTLWLPKQRSRRIGAITISTSCLLWWLMVHGQEHRNWLKLFFPRSLVNAIPVCSSGLVSVIFRLPATLSLSNASNYRFSFWLNTMTKLVMFWRQNRLFIFSKGKSINASRCSTNSQSCVLRTATTLSCILPWPTQTHIPYDSTALKWSVISIKPVDWSPTSMIQFTSGPSPLFVIFHC